MNKQLIIVYDKLVIYDILLILIFAWIEIFKYYIKYNGKTSAKNIVKFIESKIQESEIGGIK